MSATPRTLLCSLRVALLAATLAFVAAPPAALAYHTHEQRSLEDSAYVLNHKELQLGLFQLGFGFFRMQLRTRVMPWILGAALGTVSPNLHLDGMLVDRNGYTLSLGLGTYYMNSKNLSDNPDVLHVFIIPITAAFSWRINERHTVSLRGTFVRLATLSQPSEDAELDLESGRLADNFQLMASWEWRISEVSALITGLRYLPYQGDPIIAVTSMPNDNTEVQLESEVDTQDMQHAVAGSIGGMFSWKYFNLRASVAYGALFLKGSGLVLPLKYPYPEIDLYWRF